MNLSRARVPRLRPSVAEQEEERKKVRKESTRRPSRVLVTAENNSASATKAVLQIAAPAPNRRTPTGTEPAQAAQTECGWKQGLGEWRRVDEHIRGSGRDGGTDGRRRRPWKTPAVFPTVRTVRRRVASVQPNTNALLRKILLDWRDLLMEVILSSYRHRITTSARTVRVRHDDRHPGSNLVAKHIRPFLDRADRRCLEQNTYLHGGRSSMSRELPEPAPL